MRIDSQALFELIDFVAKKARTSSHVFIAVKDCTNIYIFSVLIRSVVTDN